MNWTNVDFNFPSPNYFGFNVGRRAIVLHGTAGGKWSSINWLRNPNSQASAHFVIDEQGKIYCLVDPRRGYSAWTNGDLKKPNVARHVIKYLLQTGYNGNTVSITIEHVAASTDMIAGNSMPPVQERASLELVDFLCREFKIEPGEETILAHRDFNSVDRWNCPGVIALSAYVAKLRALRAEAQPSQIELNGQVIKGEMLAYWRRLPNSLLACGLPLTGEFMHEGLKTQAFERAVLQHLPNMPQGWQVQGLHLGWPKVPLDRFTTNPLVRGLIKTYRDKLGGLSLLVLGLPLTNSFVDTDGRTTQIFERVVLKEYREYAGTEWAVQGQHLGRAWLDAHRQPGGLGGGLAA